MSADPEETASAPAQRVFISYRRQDSAPYAGRLYDAMVSRFGERNVFMDLDMPPGVDFVERITDAVSTCQVLIEVIGPTWATVKNEEGEVRIADPEDFVRLELETALRRPDVTVIPVLVSGARMPERHDLPADLGALARRNALELSDRRWHYDVGQLIATLEELLAETTAVQAVPTTTDAADGSPDAEATSPVQISAAARDRGDAGEWLRAHGRLLAGLAAIAVLAVVLGVVALGGGSGGGGNLGFEPFTGAEAFKTVEVPAGWSARKGDVDKSFSGPLGSGVKTILTGPDQEGTAEILREHASSSPQEHATSVLLDRRRDGARVIKAPDQVAAAPGLGWLIEYHWDEEGLGPATVATCLFNDGDYGWRTRAAVADKAGDSAAKAESIATRMARTLEPR